SEFFSSAANRPDFGSAGMSAELEEQRICAARAYCFTTLDIDVNAVTLPHGRAAQKFAYDLATKLVNPQTRRVMRDSLENHLDSVDAFHVINNRTYYRGAKKPNGLLQRLREAR
ncbi:hypothetical protein PMAYCL1PPCAC_20642, partial [Pristionchus mayeri]